MTDDMNSAEQEAENILKDAFAEARAEECPQGDECPVHFRVDEEYLDVTGQYARLISYVGDYVVITDDNPALMSPAFLVKLLLGQTSKADIPPRFTTGIFKVGEGVIGDLSHKPVEEKKEAFRYSEAHDVWEAVTSTHNNVVAFLEAGLIDVSKPFNPEV